MRNKEFIAEYARDLELAVKRIPLEDVEEAIELLHEAWREEKQVFLAGNGGSASTATHFASDLAKSASVEGRPRFRAVALTDNVPWITALTNDLGWSEVYVEQLRNLMREGDLLVAISVHGGSGTDRAGPWSQNLLKAVRYVKENGGRILGLTGFDGGVLKQAADVCVVVPANSTPLVEGLHLVLTHLISARLRELIAEP